MTALITYADIQARNEISVNLDATKKIAPYIQEAQQFDLKSLLGDEFYVALLKDFEASPSLQTYYDLWNGHEWTFAGHTYRHSGLKAVLIYFTYARYLASANSEVTAFGIVSKKTEQSEPISEKVLLRRIDDARTGARAYYDDVEKYMCHFPDDFQLWLQSCAPKKKRGIITGVSSKGSEYKGRRGKRWH